MQVDDLTAMFGKKKKKKNVAEFEAQLRAEDDQEPFGEEAIEESKEEAWATSSRDYSYQEVISINPSCSKEYSRFYVKIIWMLLAIRKSILSYHLKY